MTIRIEGPSEHHRAEWDRLYAGYAAFYGVPQTQEMRDRVWTWIQGPAHHVEAKFALDDDRLVGFAHFREFARPLAASRAGFLDDLFVDPPARGSGAAALLIEAVAEEGRARGWSVLRWITAEDNDRARALYDKLAAKTRWVTYDKAIG